MSKSQKNKRKKSRFSHLKKRYKDIVKRQIIRDVVLLSKSDINHDSLFVPSLTKTDTLFEKREQSNQTEDHSLNDDILIQNGYASAAALLLNIIKISSDRFVRESYINPVMFCFRQYLELSMKDSILRLRNLRKTAYRGENNLEHHNLLSLWNELKKYFDVNDTTVKCVENLINELQNVDEKGTLFRYNELLSKSICNTERRMPLIDVDNMYMRILQMYSFFEGINEIARNNLEEMAANYGEY
jgi:hypothetical protein